MAARQIMTGGQAELPGVPGEHVPVGPDGQADPARAVDREGAGRADSEQRERGGR